MQAIGLIETKGLIAAIEAADNMTKSAEVNIIDKTYVGSGLVTITITGDVGAVKAAVESGVAAVNNLNSEFLISNHIIPRPHEELKSIIGPKTYEEIIEDKIVNEEIQLEELNDKNDVETVEECEELIDDQEEGNLEAQSHELNNENLHKDDVDRLVSKSGIEEIILTLEKLKVAKLRNLAREYEDFLLKGKAISKADKNLLITKFRTYYENK